MNVPLTIDDVNFSSPQEIISLTEFRSDGMGKSCIATTINKTKIFIKTVCDRLSHDKAYYRRLVWEYNVLSALSHKTINVPSPLFIGYRPYIYVAMEYSSGLNLRDLGKIEFNQFKRLINVISIAHDMGIVHRDISDSNIIIDNDHVMLIDWGISTRFHSNSCNEIIRETGFGRLHGTYEFLPPEQLNAYHDHPDERNDIYSLAMLYYKYILSKIEVDNALKNSFLNKFLCEKFSRSRSLQELEFIADKAIKFGRKGEANG